MVTEETKAVVPNAMAIPVPERVTEATNVVPEETKTVVPEETKIVVPEKAMTRVPNETAEAMPRGVNTLEPKRRSR